MQAQPHIFNFRVMGGPAEIQIFSGNSAFESIKNALIQEAQRIEEKFSRFKPTTIVSRINQAAGEAFVEVDEETAQLISYSATCYTQSRGAFDATSGVLRQIWDFKNAVVPSKSEITRVQKLIGWEKILWQPPRIKLPIAGMEIDFGGIAKEYAVDRMAAIAQSSGASAGLVNLAGDLRVFGTRPDNTPWKIGIRHPRDAQGVIATVELLTGALATSGDYERFFEKNGTRYCHIVDPRTGTPVQNSFQSVTIFTESCLVAGSASTIAMIHGEKRGLEFLKELGLPYLVVDSMGEIHRWFGANS